MHTYKKTFALWLIMLAGFLAAVVTYAKSGEPFTLRVYEIQKLARAEQRLEQNNPNAAVVEYEEYLLVDPASVRARGALVSALIQARRTREAVAQSENGLAATRESDQGLAWLVAGRARLAGEDIEGARIAYEMASQLAPDSAEALYGFAQLHIADGRFDEAAKTIKRSADRFGRSSTEEFASERARLDNVLEALLVENHESGESAERLSAIAEIWAKMGHFDRAVEAHVQAAETEGASSGTSYWKGVDHERGGDLAAALQAYEKASQGAQRHPYARYALRRLQGVVNR